MERQKVSDQGPIFGVEIRGIKRWSTHGRLLIEVPALRYYQKGGKGRGEKGKKREGVVEVRYDQSEDENSLEADAMRGAALAMWLAMAPMEADLKPATLQAFREYMKSADQSMESRVSDPTRVQARAGQAPVIEAWSRDNPREVKDGLIHDWVGAVFVPGAKAEDAVKVLQDIPRYPQIYSGDILTSKLLRRDGERLRVLFRVVKKKVITVVLETEYDVHYRKLSERATQVWSRSVRVAEVEDHGKPGERVKAPDTGWGFLWRLNTYWHLEEKDGGLLMECRAVSLTRDIPAALGWIIKPMVTSLPREALTGTLEKTRAAVEAAAATRSAASTPRR